jgi:hypothetical protein
MDNNRLICNLISQCLSIISITKVFNKRDHYFKNSYRITVVDKTAMYIHLYNIQIFSNNKFVLAFI